MFVLGATVIIVARETYLGLMHKVNGGAGFQGLGQQSWFSTSHVMGVDRGFRELHPRQIINHSVRLPLKP